MKSFFHSASSSSAVATARWYERPARSRGARSASRASRLGGSRTAARGVAEGKSLHRKRGTPHARRCPCEPMITVGMPCASRCGRPDPRSGDHGSARTSTTASTHPLKRRGAGPSSHRHRWLRLVGPRGARRQRPDPSRATASSAREREVLLMSLAEVCSGRSRCEIRRSARSPSGSNTPVELGGGIVGAPTLVTASGGRGRRCDQPTAPLSGVRSGANGASTK